MGPLVLPLSIKRMPDPSFCFFPFHFFRFLSFHQFCLDSSFLPYLFCSCDLNDAITCYKLIVLLVVLCHMKIHWTLDGLIVDNNRREGLGVGVGQLWKDEPKKKKKEKKKKQGNRGGAGRMIWWKLMKKKRRRWEVLVVCLHFLQWQKKKKKKLCKSFLESNYYFILLTACL